MPQLRKRVSGGEVLQARFPNAHRLWTTDVQVGHPFTLTAYAIKSQVVLVLNHDEGWEVYLPASTSNRITDTLNAVEKFTT